MQHFEIHRKSLVLGRSYYGQVVVGISNNGVTFELRRVPCRVVLQAHGFDIIWVDLDSDQGKVTLKSSMGGLRLCLFESGATDAEITGVRFPEPGFLGYNENGLIGSAA